MNFSDGHEPDADARRVLDALRRVVQSLRVSARAAEAAVGLSGAQLFVLQKLATESPMSVNELARRTLTHQSSVSVVVAKLAEKKLARRRRATADARRLEVSITPAGRTILRRAPAAAQDRIIAALAAMDARDRARLAHLFERLVESAGLAGHPPGMFFDDSNPPTRRKITRGKANA